MELPSLPASVVDEDRTVSAEELGSDIRRVTAGLAARSVGAGDRVVVSLPNGYAFVAVHLALDLLGAVTVNLPTAFRREVGQVVRMVDARLSVMQELDDRRRYGDLRAVVDLADGGLEQLLGDPDAVPAHAPGPEEKTWLAFTSGSTGTPRAAVHTRASLAASTAAMAERYRLDADDAILVAAPVGHAIGFCYGVRLACDTGARLVLQRRWDASAAVALIDRERCTFAAVPTPFLADLLDAGAAPREGTLRHLLVGGAPVPREQVAEADRLLGDGIASGYYGASECGAVLSSPPDASDQQRRTSDGVPLPGIEIRIVDADDADVPDGSDGELLVRGPQVALGYWANNDSDEQFFRGGGWFATRDRAVRAADGSVSVVGRMKDLIIRGAVNVVPREVEEAVASHPGIGHVVAFGRPDRRLGERIVAAVTQAGEIPTLDELREHLAGGGLARSKWPDELHVVAELPRTASGKVDRAQVRELVLETQPAA